MKLSDYLQNGAHEGERNHTLFCAVLQAKEDGWDTGRIESELTQRARRDGLSDWEIMQTIKSAISKPVDVKSNRSNYFLDWDSPIGGNEKVISPKTSLHTQTIEFLQALFEPEEIIAYTSTFSKDKDGGLHPSGKGVYSRTCSDLIHELNKEQDTIKAFDGDKKSGVWIRLNPFDGNGIKDENVTEYRHCLVESDKIPIEKQIEIIRSLKIPCATLTHSGKKSVHAAVKIDAGNDRKLYDTRVKTLYELLNKAGMEVDRQNKNPGRLSRLAGAQRGEATQTLIGINLGCASWAEFETLSRDTLYNLKDPQEWASLRTNPPPLAPEIIEGILRQGHKMLLGGPSKAGKSFALIQLACAVAGGKEWLGYQCKKGRVLYVNLEIDEPSFIQRVLQVEAKIPFEPENLAVWNLRGRVPSLGVLTQHLLLWVKSQQPFTVLILDPIYKINEGDENSAKDMTYFCNAIERVALETKSAVVFAHHFSKGQQGAKAAIDRSSGSGVFGRDPDAIGTLTETETDHVYSLEWTLREFASPPATSLAFEWPIHVSLDVNHKLKGEGGRPPKLEGTDYLQVHSILSIDNHVSVQDMAEYLGVSAKTIRRKLDGHNQLIIEDGEIVKCS